MQYAVHTLYAFMVDGFKFQNLNKWNLRIGGTIFSSVALCSVIESMNVFGLNSGNVTILAPTANFEIISPVNP